MVDMVMVPSHVVYILSFFSSGGMATWRFLWSWGGRNGRKIPPGKHRLNHGELTGDTGDTRWCPTSLAKLVGANKSSNYGLW